MDFVSHQRTVDAALQMLVVDSSLPIAYVVNHKITIVALRFLLIVAEKSRLD